MPLARVHDVMTKDVATIDPAAPTGTALAVMATYGVANAVGGVRVRGAMTADPVTIDRDAPVARAAALMLEGGFSSLPVVERGLLVGIVTERDALRALAATEPPVPGVDPATLW